MQLPSDMVIEKLLDLAKENPKDKTLKVPLLEVVQPNFFCISRLAAAVSGSGHLAFFYQMDRSSHGTVAMFSVVSVILIWRPLSQVHLKPIHVAIGPTTQGTMG